MLFFIPAAIGHIFNPIAELAISIGIPTGDDSGNKDDSDCQYWCRGVVVLRGVSEIRNGKDL